MMKNFADVINCEIFSFLSENPEQYSARSRIKGENTIPITGPPGTGKSTVISRCCFDLLKDYSPILVVAPTNAMVDSILSKIHSLLQRVKLQLPRGFIMRYGNIRVNVFLSLLSRLHISYTCPTMKSSLVILAM